MLNVGLDYALVGSCGVKIAVKAKQKGQFLRKKSLAEKDKVVLPYLEAIIPLMPVRLPDNRDLLF